MPYAWDSSSFHRPESELEAATGDDVGRGRHIGQDGGMSVVDTGDEGSES